MQFHASKVVSALILLNTAICLAMQRGSEYDPYKIEIESVTCENRVYSKIQISSAVMAGLQSHSKMEEFNVNLDTVQYRPQPMEVMPSKDKFYFSELKWLGLNGPTDLVIFSRSGQFAKVVTRIRNNQGFKYIDCVSLPTTKFPQEHQPNLGISGQNSGEHDLFQIGITSVSCEGRVYSKRDIYEEIIRGLLSIAKLNKNRFNPDIMQYEPKPTEVMPSQGKFYFSPLTKLGPYGPTDMVIFSPNGQFAKVASLIEDGDMPYYIDCVSSSNSQSPEQSPSRMGSPGRHRLRMKFPQQKSFS